MHHRESFSTKAYAVLLTSSQLNEARKQLFTQKGRTIDGLPPTQAALIQHIKRATYQAGHCWAQMMIAAPELHHQVNGAIDLRCRVDTGVHRVDICRCRVDTGVHRGVHRVDTASSLAIGSQVKSRKVAAFTLLLKLRPILHAANKHVFIS